MATRTALFLPILLSTLAIAAQETKPVKATAGQQLVDSACRILGQNYVYPEMAVKICDYLRQKQKEGVYDNVSNNQRLAGLLTTDIRKIQPDAHLSIRYDPELETRIRTFVASPAKDKTESENERKQNFFFRKAEILQGNIGYIAFTHFADTGDLSRKTVASAMQFVANTDALVLDLRNNSGGRTEMADEIADYFFNHPQLVGRIFNRITGSWTEQWVGNRPAFTNGLFLGMPVYILTSKRTFSAAEGLAYNLKYLAGAVVVGDTTRGGAHVTRSFALGNGFVAFVPFTRMEHAATKTDWEGTGILPDVAVDEGRSLSKAQELILKQRLPLATDSMEKRKLQWLLNDLQTSQSHTIISNKTLRRYTGTFEEFVFTAEKGRLFCTNVHQPNKKDALIPITNNLFKIDNETQVEFMQGKNGTINGIRLLWSDGWVDTVKKN